MTKEELEEIYKVRGSLSFKKIMTYLPFMIMTNLSNLLLISVDGLVVGNFVGTKALASINIFSPIVIIIGVLSNFIAAAISTYLSVCMGKNDIDKIKRVKHCSKILMVVSTVFIAIAQLPIVYALINSYGVSDNMVKLTWQYAIGIMISMPFGMISTIGVCQLQIVGKMKALMVFSIVEGGVNLILDLLFVGAMNMGIAGAGYGTALANILRATMTLVYLYKKTDIFNTGKVKSNLEDMKNILASGLLELASSVMLALQNYMIVKIIVDTFGEDGGVIRGVCTFALSLVLVAINGVMGSIRPLVGLLTGSRGFKVLRILMRHSFIIISTIVGILTLVIVIYPQGIYYIHGVKTIPKAGNISLIIFSMHFLLKGFDAIFRLYFSNRKQSKFSSVVTVVGSMTMPVFAFVFSKIFAPQWVWASYILSEMIIFSLNLHKYFSIVRQDYIREENLGIIYMTVKPRDAVEASRNIRKYANSNGVEQKISYRMSLCMEEMVAYAVEANKKNNINIQIIIRFYKNGGTFLMIDDGKCLALNEDNHTRNLVTDNYNLLKKVCKDIKYNYNLDLNYTFFRFEV